jgi:hypothetical protein
MFLQFQEEMEDIQPSLGCMVGDSRQWNQGGESLQAFMHLHEASHCCIEGKPDTCQDEHFEYMPSSFTVFSTFSA